MIELDLLTKGLELLEVEGKSEGVLIEDIQISSQKVREGAMFVAMRGTKTDGHTFIKNAVDNGARAVVCECMPGERLPHVTYLRVRSTEEVVGVLATRFYGNPSEAVELVGVTGTNGKTTVATLLYNLFRGFGYKCGLVSTVCNYIDGEALSTEHTTPDAITLNSLLAHMAAEGCKYVFMECSSHAIAQSRIGGLKFAGGIFTNLTRDHMDYHITVENYLRAKKMFFDGLGKDAFMVTNLDDRNGLVMAQNCKARIRSYSLRSMSDFKGHILETHFDGMLLDICGHEVFMNFMGKFNASNLLAVYGAACMLGREPLEVLTLMSTLKPVNGRFETLRSPRGFTAIVDYAHTPDALANVLSTIQEIISDRNTGGSIITVAGAGGNRDKGKRPLMAKECVKLSDKFIATSDNPRFEEPQAIIDDMLAGLTAQDMKKVIAIVDREQAIRTACMLAGENDVVLVAGKGHENYQEIKGVKLHFDDHEVLIANMQ